MQQNDANTANVNTGAFVSIYFSAQTKFTLNCRMLDYKSILIMTYSQHYYAVMTFSNNNSTHE